jgi:hypothetical protein
VKGIVSLIVAGALVICGVQTVRGDGWSFSSLNPFASKKEPAAPPPKKSSASPSFGSNVPQLNGKPIRPAAPPPSMISKIASAPSTMWSKTKQVFTPAPKPAPNNKPFTGTLNKTPPSTTSSSWNPFVSKPTAAQPRTTSEFIGMPRPGRELSAQ